MALERRHFGGETLDFEILKKTTMLFMDVNVCVALRRQHSMVTKTHGRRPEVGSYGSVAPATSAAAVVDHTTPLWDTRAAPNNGYGTAAVGLVPLARCTPPNRTHTTAQAKVVGWRTERNRETIRENACALCFCLPWGRPHGYCFW